MPIDASIYQNLKSFEMPSYADSKQKAMSLKQLGMQNDRMQKQGAMEDRTRKLTALGSALESMADLPEEAKPVEYLRHRESLIRDGIIGPQDAPEMYDPQIVNPFMAAWKSSDAYRERQKQTAETELLQAKAKAAIPDAEMARKLQGAQIDHYKAQSEKDRAEAKHKGIPKGFQKQFDPVTGEEVIVPIAKQLPAEKVLSVNEGNNMPKLMDKLEATIGSNADSFGPVSGRMGSINPYNTTAQTIQSQMKAASQLVGKYMEDGVLRKEDEVKYEKMLPTMSDTPEVARNKLAIVRNMLAEKQKSNLAALKGSNYDTTGVDGNVNVPNLPDVLTKGPRGGRDVVPEANAGDVSAPDKLTRVVNGITYVKVNGGWKRAK